MTNSPFEELNCSGESRSNAPSSSRRRFSAAFRGGGVRLSTVAAP